MSASFKDDGPPSAYGLTVAHPVTSEDLSVNGSAPSLLLTVLGEFVLPAETPVWTAALLYVLEGLGIEQQTARQAIARCADTGLITGEKHGRLVRWNLTDAGISSIEETTRRVMSLSSVPEHWDGYCLILVVSVPQRQKAVRKRLYRALTWAGFGNPAPGLWATPHAEREEEMKQIIREFDLQGSTMAFRGTTVAAGLTDAEVVQRAWDFDEVADRYRRFIETFEGLAPPDGDELLFTYTAMINEWREFPSIDPQLPYDLLPDWVGRRANEMVLELRTKWSGAAHLRWQEIVEGTRPSG